MHISQLVSSLQVVAVLYGCNASPVIPHSSYAVKERHAVPRDWVEIGSAPEKEVISLQIGLKQSNEGVVEQHLLQVSDPGHARYGQHLTSAEVDDIITPSDDTLRLVRSWLHRHNITDFASNPAADWIYIPSISVKDAENLLQTKYSVFVHRYDGTSVIRTPEWSLPLHLHEHIDVVQPTTSFFRPSKREKRAKLAERSTDLVLDGGEEHEASWWETHGKALYGVSLRLFPCSFSFALLLHASVLQIFETLFHVIFINKMLTTDSIGPQLQFDKFNNIINLQHHVHDFGMFANSLWHN
jgi:tripeptidyl-peptidase-1